MSCTRPARLFQALVATIYLFIFAPLVIVVLVSLNGGSVAAIPSDGVSLRWYAKALATPSFTASLVTSLWLAIAATLVATPPAFAAALAIARGGFPGRGALEAFFLAPLLIPGIVIGIALLLSYTLVGVGPGPGRLLAAHVLIAFPYGVRTILAGLSRSDPALLEAARTLGASPLRAFRHVTLPMAVPGVAAGMAFGFLQSFGDVPVSLFLADARNTTMPLAIMGYLEYSADPSVAAMSSMVTIASLGLALLLERLFGLRKVIG